MEAEARPLISISEGPLRPQFYTRQAARFLPTDRIAFSRQLEILEAWAEGPADNNEIGRRVGLNASTVSLSNPFFVSIGFLQRGVRAHLPSPDVIEFAKKGDATKLGPLLSKTWIAKALIPSLPLDEPAAIDLLAKEAAVSPDNRRDQLILLIDYLEAAGMVDRQGGEVRDLKPENSRGQHERKTDDGTEQPEYVKVSTTISYPSRVVMTFDACFPVEFSEWNAGLIKYLQGVADGVARVFPEREHRDPQPGPISRNAQQPKQSTRSTAPDLSHWLTKREVCERLQIADRTVDRLTDNGKLEKSRRFCPGRRPEPIYNPEDVERIAIAYRLIGSEDISPVLQNHDPWVSKAEAAVLLGMCFRSLDRFVNEGNVRRQAGPGNQRFLYNREDLQRIAALRSEVIKPGLEPRRRTIRREPTASVE